MTAAEPAVARTQAAAAAAEEKKAEDVVAFDVSEQLAIAEVFLICSAQNERQVNAIVDSVQEQLREVPEDPARPLRREGEREGRWVLLDYGDLVVHVMHVEDRAYYALERLWKDCPTVPLPAGTPQ